MARLLALMRFIHCLFLWSFCSLACATLGAQSLSYDFSVSGQSLTPGFPVENMEVLQARGTGTDWQIDLIVRSKLSNQQLQLLTKAGRYNLELLCQDGKCKLQAPNLSKKIDLPGSEVKEQIYMRVLAGEGVYAQSGSLQSKNGALPAKLKIRIIPEGTDEPKQPAPGSTAPASNPVKRSSGLGGEIIGIE